MSPQAPFPDAHIIQSTQPHTHTIIALHGRGSNGTEFAEELFEDKTPNNQTLPEALPSCKWIFPTSRTRHSTVFQEDMTEWFDLYSTTDPSKEADLQVEGLRDSIKYVLALIEEEISFTKPEKIILLGTSQGCATAVHALLAGNYRLGGLVGLCGWMPFRKQIEEHIELGRERKVQGLCLEGFYEKTLGLQGMAKYNTEGNARTPVYLAHCDDDDVIDVALGRELDDTLRCQLGMKVTWIVSATGGHWVDGPQGLKNIVDWMVEKVNV
ncbi:MAG: hypothetical protein Q9209_004510 [Squamulea sp. 1 TL-2023]